MVLGQTQSRMPDLAYVHIRSTIVSEAEGGCCGCAEKTNMDLCRCTALIFACTSSSSNCRPSYLSMCCQCLFLHKLPKCQQQHALTSAGSRDFVEILQFHVLAGSCLYACPEIAIRGLQCRELACLRKGSTFSSFLMGPMAASGTSGNHHRGLKRSYTCSGSNSALQAEPCPCAHFTSRYVQQGHTSPIVNNQSIERPRPWHA